MMVYHDLPLGWLTLCKPASMQITLRINTSELHAASPSAPDVKEGAAGVSTR